jgi:hypothetical protein
MATPKKAEDSTPEEEPAPLEAEGGEPEPVDVEDEDPNWYPEENDLIGGGPLTTRPHRAKST